MLVEIHLRLVVNAPMSLVCTLLSCQFDEICLKEQHEWHLLNVLIVIALWLFLLI